MKRSIATAVVLGIFLTAAIVHFPSPAQADLGIDFTGDVAASGWVENGGPGTFIPGQGGFTTVGWRFTPTTDLYLSRLGLFDADRDRLHSESHQVAIWSASDPTSPLASVTINEGPANHVPETSPNGALFHFESLTVPYLLSRGETYVVGATLYAGAATGGRSSSDFDSFAAFSQGDSPVFISPYVSYLGNAYGIRANNALLFPSSTWGPVDYTIGANIDVTPVPIPGAAWLFGSGIAALAGIRRRTRQAC